MNLTGNITLCARADLEPTVRQPGSLRPRSLPASAAAAVALVWRRQQQTAKPRLISPRLSSSLLL